MNLDVLVGEDRIVKVTLMNESNENINHGFMLFLEEKVDGDWYRLVEKIGFADVGLVLEPDEEWVQEIELDNWESANSGVFRVYKTYSTNSKKPAAEAEKNKHI